ncbi:MAG: hypothetical protein WDW36_005797 [Sanguina aurantia]
MPTFSSLVEVHPAGQTADNTEFGPTYRAAFSTEQGLAGDVKTLFELFQRSSELYADRPCLGERAAVAGVAQPFEFLTYKESATAVADIAAGYARLGIVAMDKVGIIGANCREWMIAMQACNRQSLCCVPLYETLGDNAVEFVLSHSEARMVVAAAAKLPVLRAALPKVSSTLTLGVVYWGEAAAADVEAIKGLGYSVHSWAELAALGRETPVFPEPPAPEDLCTIMYTSGTTGDPKGVMLSHRAVISTIAAVVQYMAHHGEILDANDSFLSYLPLAHIFDRVVEEFMLSLGARIGYWRGDIRKLGEDIEAFKPTLFAGVPRVFERVVNGVKDKLKGAGFVSNTIFNIAKARKLHFMKAGFRHNEASVISDRLVFNKIKSKLGGRVRVIITGGAPMAESTEEFMRVTMCAPVVQGYGLTETCAASCIASPFNFNHCGTVGAPMPMTELRLVAVPEMKYCPTSDPPKGEVCLRGPGLFSGYFKNEEMTKETMDADGFFRTGDIGEILADGTLRIFDRKKNIFKLSQGEYIAAEKLENVYKGCEMVEQIWVYGDSFKSCVVAVVVPKETSVMAWATEKGMEGDFKTLVATPAFNKCMLQALEAAGRAGKLKKGLEEVKAVHLSAEQFSVENDLLTPTFKLKRGPLKTRFTSEIDALYAALPA